MAARASPLAIGLTVNGTPVTIALADADMVIPELELTAVIVAPAGIPEETFKGTPDTVAPVGAERLMLEPPTVAIVAPAGIPD